MEKIHASVLVFDTRNFTDNLKNFTSKSDDSFILLIESMCDKAIKIVEALADKNDFYFNSTGDGFISIFFGKHASIKCYLLSLIINITHQKLCNQFKNTTGQEISFGIGLESGFVQKIIARAKERELYTYIGNVINIAARIESETKSHSRARIILGEEINQILVKDLYQVDYKEKMELVKNGLSQNDPVRIIDEMNHINQDMMLSYIFEHKLKGLDSPIPLFRVSPSLSNSEKPFFKIFINKLLDILNCDYQLRQFIDNQMA